MKQNNNRNGKIVFESAPADRTGKTTRRRDKVGATGVKKNKDEDSDTDVEELSLLARSDSSCSFGVRPLVTILGITGYVGAQVCLKFLQDGDYRVRGTVRNKTNDEKLDPLKEAFGDLYDQLEIVEADIMNDETLYEAIAESEYVVHIATPPYVPGFADDLTEHTVKSTMAVLHACRQARIKRYVYTSSCAAVQNMATRNKPKDRTFSERHWSDPNRQSGLKPLMKSKTMAEKAVWDFHDNLPIFEQFEVATICPGYIMGPPIGKAAKMSESFVERLMMGDMHEISADHCCAVDVRDVAQAHLAAIKEESAANRRFILV